MEIFQLSPEETAVRRYVEELWLPYQRDLEATIDTHDLADDVDIAEAEVDFRVDRLESDDFQILIAVDSTDDATNEQDITVTSDALVGFIAMEISEAPAVFDQPDRLRICDVYLTDEYRGDGVAEQLVKRAAKLAQEEGCSELTLDVDVDNERAVGFYEKVGFETVRKEKTATTSGLLETLE